MRRSLNVAMPATAAAAVVPERTAPVGPEPSEIVTWPANLVRVAPFASCALRLTAGAMAPFDATLVGRTVKPSRVGGTRVWQAGLVSRIPPNAAQQLALPV